jgi:hypothetical protein
MTQLTTTPESLLHGGRARLPRNVATCPECNASLEVRSTAWIEATGTPIGCALEIDCIRDVAMHHRYHQSDWQPVVDVVRRWAGSVSG